MAALTADQIGSLAAQWTGVTNALTVYRNTARDPNVDKVLIDGFIQQAAQIATNFSVATLTADFADTGAFDKLRGVLTQANGYIAVLAAKQKSWNRFSAVATSAIGFATKLAGPAGAILSAGDALAKACAGSPGASPSTN